MRAISGLAKIAARYDAFLIDQFGVLHDGRALYPGALDALEHLHAASKPVVILTNSGKRNAANRERVVAMGVAPHLFREVLSSGEVAWAAIKNGEFGAIETAFIIGKAGDDYGFDDLGLAFASTPEHAQIILFLGSNAPATPLDEYHRLLAPAAKRDVRALCCNPDRQMLTSAGLQPAPGAIAAIYEKLGGRVTWIGKPHLRIYVHAIHLLGDVAPARTLSIGDSVAHDVRGGRGAGLATALVRTGVSAPLDDAELKRVMGEESVEPDWLLPRLKWT